MDGVLFNVFNVLVNFLVVITLDHNRKNISTPIIVMSAVYSSFLHFWMFLCSLIKDLRMLCFEQEYILVSTIEYELYVETITNELFRIIVLNLRLSLIRCHDIVICKEEMNNNVSQSGKELNLIKSSKKWNCPRFVNN